MPVAGVLLSLATKLPTPGPASSELVQPPHRGLLELPDLQLKQLLPGGAVRPHHQAGLGASAAAYQRVETAGSEEWEAAAATAPSLLQAPGEAGVDSGGVLAAVHTESELFEAGELHRRGEHAPRGGHEGEAQPGAAAAGPWDGQP